MQSAFMDTTLLRDTLLLIDVTGVRPLPDRHLDLTFADGLKSAWLFSMNGWPRCCEKMPMRRH